MEGIEALNRSHSTVRRASISTTSIERQKSAAQTHGG